MDKQTFVEWIETLMRSKNKHIDTDTIKVWHKLLIDRKKYTLEQLSYALDKLCYLKIDYPTVADVVLLLEPKQDYEIEAERELMKIDRLCKKEESHKDLSSLTRRVFKQVFNSAMDYRNIPVKDLSYLRRDFIRLYSLEKKEDEREQAMIEMNNIKLIK